MSASNSERAADAAAVGSWGAWIASHIVDVNAFLQTILLLAGIVSSIYAIAWYRKRLNEKHDGVYMDTGVFEIRRKKDDIE